MRLSCIRDIVGLRVIVTRGRCQQDKVVQEIVSRIRCDRFKVIDRRAIISGVIFLCKTDLVCR